MIKLDSDFYNTFDELSKLNESYKPVADSANKDEAANRFYSVAQTERAIDMESFHIAFDSELNALGLLGVFDDAGMLVNKGTYGAIKEADQSNPAVRALKKLWVFVYSNGLPTLAAKQEADAQRAEAEKRKADEKEATANLIASTKQYILDTINADSELTELYNEGAKVFQPEVFYVSISTKGAPIMHRKNERTGYRVDLNNEELAKKAIKLFLKETAQISRASSAKQSAAESLSAEAKAVLSCTGGSAWYVTADGALLKAIATASDDASKVDIIDTSKNSEDTLAALPENAELVCLMISDAEQYGGHRSPNYGSRTKQYLAYAEGISESNKATINIPDSKAPESDWMQGIASRTVMELSDYADGNNPLYKAVDKETLDRLGLTNQVYGAVEYSGSDD